MIHEVRIYTLLFALPAVSVTSSMGKRSSSDSAPASEFGEVRE